MAKVAVVSSPAVERAATAGAALLVGRDPWADLPSDTARTIVHAGIAAFAERGFHGTNLKTIIQGTGLSTAALYVHFSSKEDLLYTIAYRGYVAAVGIFDEATEISDPLESLRVLIYAYTRWHAEFHTTSRVVEYEKHALTPEHRAELLKLQRRAERKARAVVARGMADGVFTAADPRGVTTAVLSMSIDVARWYESKTPYSPDELGRLYCELATRMVGVFDGA